MTTIVNPYAAGGRGRGRWTIVAPLLPHRPGRHEVCVLGPETTVADAVRGALDRGEREFLAAGGDGTVNALINALAAACGADALRDITLGAVGLGSSNDFHKPYGRTLGGFPARIDFARAVLRDAGCLLFDSCRRFFLVNASAGVTASANAFFNRPDRALRLLKTAGTSLAIGYAALHTIGCHEAVPAKVVSESGTLNGVLLSNLAVLQSPYVSGSLRFPDGALPGRFSVYLHASLGRLGLVRLLAALRRGRCTDGGRLHHWKTRFLEVSAERPFAVEYDGETAETASVSCSVHPNMIRICP